MKLIISIACRLVFDGKFCRYLYPCSLSCCLWNNCTGCKSSCWSGPFVGSGLGWKIACAHWLQSLEVILSNYVILYSNRHFIFKNIFEVALIVDLREKMYSRWTCRNCSLASNITSGNLRPCDFKMGKILSTRQAFRCTYDFDLRWTFVC